MENEIFLLLGKCLELTNAHLDYLSKPIELSAQRGVNSPLTPQEVIQLQNHAKTWAIVLKALRDDADGELDKTDAALIEAAKKIIEDENHGT